MAPTPSAPRSGPGLHRRFRGNAPRCRQAPLLAAGCQILKTVAGRVSTEVDAGLGFHTQATLAGARKLIAMCQQAGGETSVRDIQDGQQLATALSLALPTCCLVATMQESSMPPTWTTSMRR